MNHRKIAGIFALLVSSVILFFTACKKENSTTSTTGTRQLSVYLTDDPCRYDSVFIDIRYVEVKVDTSEEHKDDDHYGDKDIDRDDDHKGHDEFGKWDTLTITPGVYNIIKLRNGVDTLLGKANLPKGAIRKIRLTLGNNNAVVVAGVSHPLKLFPGTNNYVYIKIHNEDADDNGGGRASVWLDFNVCESILLDNGQYYLKPVIKPFGKKQFGSIEGKVLPLEAHAMVKASNGVISATAIPEDDNGEYKIRGLQEGSYTILFQGSNGYKDSTLTNIQVRKGQETKLPLVTLRK